jgi:hypothetical protein
LLTWLPIVTGDARGDIDVGVLEHTNFVNLAAIQLA